MFFILIINLTVLLFFLYLVILILFVLFILIIFKRVSFHLWRVGLLQHYVIWEHLIHATLLVPHFSQHVLNAVHFKVEARYHCFHFANLFLVWVSAIIARVARIVAKLVSCSHLHQIMLRGWSLRGTIDVLLVIHHDVIADRRSLSHYILSLIWLRSIESGCFLLNNSPLWIISSDINGAVQWSRSKKSSIDQSCYRLPFWPICWSQSLNAMFECAWSNDVIVTYLSTTNIRNIWLWPSIIRPYIILTLVLFFVLFSS